MTKWRVKLISALALAAVAAELYFRNECLLMAVSSAYMLCLAVGAVLVGRIPRRPRQLRDKIAGWLIGWPIFLTNLALTALSCREMVVLKAPSWILIIAFFWALAYLTWKVFIDPNTGYGGWWRGGGGGPDDPQPFPHGPPSAHRALPGGSSLSWRQKFAPEKIAALN